jgi:2-oxoglutarate ferredoxin oxidoreductase subunit beta
VGGIEGGSRFYSLHGEAYDPCIPVGADRHEQEQKISQCVIKAQEWGQRIPLGVFYRDPVREEMSENIVRQHATYRESPPAKQPVLDERNRIAIDWQRLLQEFVVSR